MPLAIAGEIASMVVAKRSARTLFGAITYFSICTGHVRHRRSSTRATCVGDHSPDPRAVGMPYAFNPRLPIKAALHSSLLLIIPTVGSLWLKMRSSLPIWRIEANRVLFPSRFVGRRCHAPDCVANVVGHEQRAVFVDPQPDGPALRLAILVEESGQDVARRAGGFAVLERHEDHLV